MALGVALLGLVIAVAWTVLWYSEAGANWLWRQAQTATDGRLAGGEISGSLARGATIGALSWHDDGMSVDVDGVALQLDVDLLPPAVVVRDASFQRARIESSTGGDSAPPESSLPITLQSLALPLVLDIEQLTGSEVIVVREGSAPMRFGEIGLELRWHDSIEIDALRFRYDEATLRASGAIELQQEIPLSLQVNVTHPDEIVDVTVSGTAELPSLVFRTQGISAKLEGSVDLEIGDRLLLIASVDAEYLRLNRFVDSWPQAHPLAGNLLFELSDNEVRVSESTMRIIDTDAESAFAGTIDLGEERVDATLSWSNLRWPIDGTAVSVASDSGDVEIGGTLNDWSARGDVAVATAQMPDGRFRLAAEGNREGLELRIDEGRVFGGVVEGEATYRWRGASPWSADLSVAGVQTADLFPEWPGTISGHMDASGTRQPFAVNGDLDRISGELAGRPFRADGSFAHDSERTVARNLQLRHGTLDARLDGSVDTDAGLKFDLVIGELGDYLAAAQGEIRSRGVVSRASDEPLVELELSSPSLSWNQHVVDDLDLTVDGADRAQSAELQGRYRVFGSADTPLDWQLGLKGAFDDWRQPLASTWRGELTTLTLQLEERYGLTLASPATLVASPDTLSLHGLCLVDGRDAEICAAVEQPQDGSLALNASLEELHLALLDEFLDAGLSFDQRVSGSLDWSLAPQSEPSGNAEFTISAGRIRSSETPERFIETGPGVVSFEMLDGNVLNALVSLPMSSNGHVNAELNLLDVAAGPLSDIDGSVDVAMQDFGLLAEMLPLVDTLTGSLIVDLSLSGRAAEPDIGGNIRLADGQLRYAPIGMQLDAIDLTAKLTPGQAAEIEGGFTAGDGRAQISSSASYAGTTGVQLQVRGSDLQLVNVPDLQATVSPSIDLEYQGGRLHIDGDVTIPRARVRPANLAESRVTESDDVVIVAGETADESKPQDDSRTEWSGNLDLTLGDDVRVELDVARASLTGATAFSWHGDPIPTADGRFDLSGKIEAFGQVLDITEGGIRFPAVPATDPVIRLRAERDIYGNSQVKQAGVLVDGTLSQPSIEAYTVPMTNQERALTLLVTGSDFDYEQGVGAIDFGTYVAPRLFLSYGIGIFDRDNVISARYDLSRGFGIKASSGSKQSGVDLNYRFEN